MSITTPPSAAETSREAIPLSYEDCILTSFSEGKWATNVHSGEDISTERKFKSPRDQGKPIWG